MYKQGTPEFAHHVATYGPQSKFGYKDFIPQFKAERFSAPEWARLFKDAGAKFVVPVAEHHDGFPMYDCSLTEWSRREDGAEARHRRASSRARCRPKGLVLRPLLPPRRALVVLRRRQRVRLRRAGPALRRLLRPGRARRRRPRTRASRPRRSTWTTGSRAPAELVDKYHPQLVWFDWWIEQPAFAPYLQRFAAFYYNRGAEWQKGVAINYKNASFPAKAAVFDVERGQLPGIRPEFWQTDTSISKNSWGYVAKQDYKTAGAIVGRPRRHRQQERRPAAEHRPAARRHHPRAGAGDPARDRAVAEGERRGDLRHPAVGRVRRGADRGRGRQLQRHEAAGVHRAGHPLHDEAGRPLRDRARVAGKDVHREGARHRRRAREGARHRRAPAGTRGPLAFTQDAAGLHVTLPEKAPGEHAFAFRIEGVS